MSANVVHSEGRAVEKPIDFWLRKGKTGGEPKSTEIKVAHCQTICDLIAERDSKADLIKKNFSVIAADSRARC